MLMGHIGDVPNFSLDHIFLKEPQFLYMKRIEICILIIVIFVFRFL